MYSLVSSKFYWTQDYTFVHVLIRPTLCNENLMENYDNKIHVSQQI